MSRHELKKSDIEEIYNLENLRQCNLGILTKNAFDQFTADEYRTTVGKLYQAYTLIRHNKTREFKEFPLLEWEKNLKDQKIWDKLIKHQQSGLRKVPQSKSFLHHAIMHNALQSVQFFIDSKSYAIDTGHLECAIDNHAESVFEYFLQHVSLTEEERIFLIERACKLGNITIVSRLYQGPDSDLHYFKKMIDITEDSKQDVFSIVLWAYRNSDMQNVEAALFKYIRKLQGISDFNAIVKQIKTARDIFFDVFNVMVPRYLKKTDLEELSEEYLSWAPVNLEQEIQLGLDKSRVITNLSENKQTEINLPEDFKEKFPLPSDCKDCEEDFYSMRALLYIFSEANYQCFLKRKSLNLKNLDIVEQMYVEKSLEELKDFKTPRLARRLTPFGSNRYDHAVPFAEGMLTWPHHKKTDCVIKPVINKCGLPSSPAYVLIYKGIEMSGILLKPMHFYHGQAPIKKIWPWIEKLNREIFKMSQKKILKNPRTFYNKIVEVIWLVGNLTPWDRGTGCHVEQWLTWAHKYHKHHNLQMLVLKRGLQLDVLDLIFSLPIYQKLFLSFFEPNSIMPFVFDDYLRQCQTDPETIRLLEHFKIDVSKIKQTSTLADFLKLLNGEEITGIRHTVNQIKKSRTFCVRLCVSLPPKTDIIFKLGSKILDLDDRRRRPSITPEIKEILLKKINILINLYHQASSPDHYRSNLRSALKSLSNEEKRIIDIVCSNHSISCSLISSRTGTHQLIDEITARLQVSPETKHHQQPYLKTEPLLLSRLN